MGVRWVGAIFFETVGACRYVRWDGWRPVAGEATSSTGGGRTVGGLCSF